MQRLGVVVQCAWIAAYLANIFLWHKCYGQLECEVSMDECRSSNRGESFSVYHTYNVSLPRLECNANENTSCVNRLVQFSLDCRNTVRLFQAKSSAACSFNARGCSIVCTKLLCLNLAGARRHPACIADTRAVWLRRNEHASLAAE